MTYFTKLLLSKIPFEDLVNFILDSNKHVTTLTTIITYREHNNFCYMLERRKFDETILNLEVFYAPQNTITGIITGDYLETKERLSSNDIFFRSTLYPDQNFNVTILDGSIMPNIDLTTSVKIRAYAEAESILSIDTITPILNTSSTYDFINSSVLQKEESAVAPIGLIRCFNHKHPNTRIPIMSKNSLIVGKIKNIKKIKFNYKNKVKKDLIVYKVNTPFLGTIDVIDTKMLTQIDIHEGNYLFARVQNIFGTLLNYEYENRINYNQFEIMKYIQNKVKTCDTLDQINDYIENNAKTYWNGQLIGTKKETLIKFLNFDSILYTHYFPLKEIGTPEIALVKEVNFDEEVVKTILSFFTMNNDIKDQLKRWINVLNAYKDKALEKKEIRISKEHYEKFIDKFVITMLSEKSNFAYKNILFTFSSKGKIDSMEICDFPIFQINYYSPNRKERYSKHIPENRQDRLIKTNVYPIPIISRNLQVNKKVINIPFPLFMNYSLYVNSIFLYINQYLRSTKIDSNMILEHPLSFLHYVAWRDGLMENSLLYCTLPHAFEYFYSLGKEIKYNPYPLPYAEDIAIYIFKATENNFNYVPFKNNKILQSIYDELIHLIQTDTNTFMEAINSIAMFFLRIGYEESILSTE